jgi:hypothetical protein
MIISEVVTLGIYAFSMVFLPEYFGASDPTLYSALPRRSQHFCHCLFFFVFASQIYRLSYPCGSGGKWRSLLL